ncbi:MAG TPA: TetR family transcriptional regulator, partial [Candidatus Blautia ornithocaccae]|nr:TetR family transcriptional regulator [Candidatus Blautia ornithocaccae]
MDNRELLLDAALDLFYAKGYDAVGVQEIVDRA